MRIPQELANFFRFFRIRVERGNRLTYSFSRLILQNFFCCPVEPRYESILPLNLCSASLDFDDPEWRAVDKSLKALHVFYVGECGCGTICEQTKKLHIVVGVFSFYDIVDI